MQTVKDLGVRGHSIAGAKIKDQDRPQTEQDCSCKDADKAFGAIVYKEHHQFLTGGKPCSDYASHIKPGKSP